MKALIIRNPISGSPRRQLAFARAVEVFEREGWDVQVWVTERKGHARVLAEKAALQGFQCVIVAGGDGSIGQAVDGLLHSGVSDVQLGVIPMGTGNVFAREVGLPYPKTAHDDAPARAARIIIDNEPVRVDVGQANGNSFLCWSGVGLDAIVTAEVESHLDFKRRAPLLSYGWTTVKELVAFDPAQIQLQLDGGETFSGPFPLVVASNIQLYARYFRVTPGAKIDDGLLDVLIFTDASRLKFLLGATLMVVAPNGSAPGVIRRQTRHLSIISHPSQPYHLDGDPLGMTPLEIDILPRRLPIRLNRERIAAALL